MGEGDLKSGPRGNPSLGTRKPEGSRKKLKLREGMKRVRAPVGVGWGLGWWELKISGEQGAPFPSFLVALGCVCGGPRFTTQKDLSLHGSTT